MKLVSDLQREGMRDGAINVEGQGELSARNLFLKAESVTVDVYGRINLDKMGLLNGGGEGYGTLV